MDDRPRFADDPDEAAAQVKDLADYGNMWTRIDADGTAHRIDPADMCPSLQKPPTPPDRLQ